LKERRTAPVVRLLRAARLAWHALQGLLTTALLFPFLAPPARDKLIRSWSAKLLVILRVRLTIQGDLPRRGKHGILFVANHVSWLDIFLLNAVHPMRFVAKREVRDWPLAGFLAASAGTLFLDRSRRRDAGRANRDIESALLAGDFVALFPEGTTSDGRQVRHFHAALLQPAIDAEAPLQAVAIRYSGKNGEPDTAPAYIDALSFGDSLHNILLRPAIQAELHFSPALAPHGRNRRELAGALHNAITHTLPTQASAS
jgi:1-acyl-sn-glycerol-3-phosphate acyltransferase